MVTWRALCAWEITSVALHLWEVQEAGMENRKDHRLKAFWKLRLKSPLKMFPSSCTVPLLALWACRLLGTQGLVQRWESFQAALAKVHFNFLNQKFSGLTEVWEVRDLSHMEMNSLQAAGSHVPPAHRGCWLPWDSWLYLRMEPSPFYSDSVSGPAHPQLLTPGLTDRPSESG